MAGLSFFSLLLSLIAFGVALAGAGGTMMIGSSLFWLAAIIALKFSKDKKQEKTLN